MPSTMRISRVGFLAIDSVQNWQYDALQTQKAPDCCSVWSKEPCRQVCVLGSHRPHSWRLLHPCCCWCSVGLRTFQCSTIPCVPKDAFDNLFTSVTRNSKSFKTNLLAVMVVWRLALSAHRQDILSLISATSKSFHENLKSFYVSALKESLAVLPGSLICINMHSPGMKK